MAIYDGVVILADDQIPAIVELDDEHVRLSASGTEIGQWPVDECRIDHKGDSIYTISAEDETLEFVPNRPGLFAAALNGSSEEAIATPRRVVPDPVSTARAEEAPPPKPLTMGLFYALCLVTAVLAIWSLITIIF